MHTAAAAFVPGGRASGMGPRCSQPGALCNESSSLLLPRHSGCCGSPGGHASCKAITEGGRRETWARQDPAIVANEMLLTIAAATADRRFVQLANGIALDTVSARRWIA